MTKISLFQSGTVISDRDNGRVAAVERGAVKFHVLLFINSKNYVKRLPDASLALLDYEAAFSAGFFWVSCT